MRALAVLALALLLAGCGFHLRGSGGLPDGMAVTYIQGIKPWSRLHGNFRDALEGHGVLVYPEAGRADGGAVYP